MSTNGAGFGRAVFGYLKATIIGGLLFLLPIVLLALVLGKAMHAAAKIAKPAISHLPPTFLGIGMASLLAALILIAISLGAGLLARTRYGKATLQWFEDSLFGGLPQYQLVKSLGEGLAHALAYTRQIRCPRPHRTRNLDGSPRSWPNIGLNPKNRLGCQPHPR